MDFIPLKGGVVIVYERKVKMLYGKFLDCLFFS
jgi:hypothetical protein